MRARVLTFALLSLAVVALPRPAAAIVLNVPCQRPSVFPGSALNVVVLPYEQPASLGPSRAGEQLAALVQLETLVAIAKFGSIGVTQLVGEPDAECTPEIVLDKLLGRTGGAAERLRPGAGLIVIWGRIFESGSELFYQSYVQFLRAGVAESVEVRIREQTLTAALATQAFACAPRKIALRDLEDIRRQFAAARLLHRDPAATSPVVPIPEGSSIAYWVTEVRGDWVRLQPMDRASGNQGTPGWLPVRTPDTQWSLRRQMPELLVVEGVAGYLAARVQPRSPQVQAWLAASDAAIARYLETWGANAILGGDAVAGGTPLAVALPRQVRAFVALLRNDGATAGLDAALPEVTRAATLVPYSSQARNLATVLRMARAYRDEREVPTREYIDQFRTLLGADPDDARLLANLVAAYDLALASAPVTLPAAERQRLDRERAALVALRKSA